MSAVSSPTGGARERRLYALLVQYLDALDAGRPPELAGLVARHPDLGRELCEFAAAERWLAGVTAPVRRAAGENRGQR